MSNFLLYIKYPTWIHPEIFPNVPVLGLLRWYGLMYIFAFVTAFLILRKEKNEGALNTEGYAATDDDIFSFIACGIIFLLIGARVFSTLVYDTSGKYLKAPWLIFWPFDSATKKFTGLAGMSYHGGFIGGLVGTLLWCHWHKKPTLKWIDAIVVAIPAGYTFGRIGNFLNGELYGRITTMPWGVIFRHAEPFSYSLDWVKEFAAQCKMVVPEGLKLIDLPRHPSQLYEALFEGLAVFLLLWNVRKHKPFDGFLTALYTISYGFVRFIIEYFREPDSDLGYRISKDGSKILYRNTSLLNLSTGQVFCALMILGGLVFMTVLYLRNKKKATPCTPEN
ncbi:MAG: prolipoprotein diacylglyceryl transferase [Treponema sp.]|nr:prolipoprotein diacylglyceryl transferase [Treponema sp.]MBR4385357.1 prolipoprotein diacylglyceryl transferase [Treponema sp.]